MINAYLRDPVTIVRHAALDSYNERAASTLDPIMGYVEWGTRLVRNLQGEEVAAAARVMIRYDATITHDDKVQIGTLDYTILRIEEIKDFSKRGLWIYIT